MNNETLEREEFKGDEADAISQLIEANLEKLQDHFVKLREWHEMPITKDNCEALFDSWIQTLDTYELKQIID